MTIKSLITKYQKAFNYHDLNKLSELFDNKIRLKDWDIDEMKEFNFIKEVNFENM